MPKFRFCLSKIDYSISGGDRLPKRKLAEELAVPEQAGISIIGYYVEGFVWLDVYLQKYRKNQRKFVVCIAGQHE